MPMPSNLRRVLMERANPVASFQVEADRSLEIRPVERSSALVSRPASSSPASFSSELPQSVFGPATLAMQLAASLGVPPALMVLCLIPSYYGTMDPWGIPRTPWLQAQDHFVLITYACTVVGMVAVLTWERFLPTLLEARVAGLSSHSERPALPRQSAGDGAFLCGLSRRVKPSRRRYSS